MLNHAAFKGLLFFGAGAALHGAGTRDMNKLGGLLKRMRVSGACFLVGAVAISALPPLNGFVSEFLIYSGAFQGIRTSAAIPVLVVIGALSLIGGLAAACFTRAFGMAFLGEPRSEAAQHAHEAGIGMRAAMILLAVACFGIGVASPWLIGSLASVLPGPAIEIHQELSRAGGVLEKIVIVSAVFLGLVLVLAALRRALLSGRTIDSTVTWDCGYARPTARMQYTATSFGQPLVDLFSPLLRTRKKLAPPKGLFPKEASHATETPDLIRESGFRRAFAGIDWVLSQARRLQHGNLHLYVLYIALTLFILLVWKLS